VCHAGWRRTKAADLAKHAHAYKKDALATPYIHAVICWIRAPQRDASLQRATSCHPPGFVTALDNCRSPPALLIPCPKPKVGGAVSEVKLVRRSDDVQSPGGPSGLTHFTAFRAFHNDCESSIAAPEEPPLLSPPPPPLRCGKHMLGFQAARLFQSCHCRLGLALVQEFASSWASELNICQDG
jgi:hypothetical protein